MKTIKIKVEPNKNPRNEFHLHVQKKYRMLIQEDKTKYKRCKYKRNSRKEISDTL